MKFTFSENASRKIQVLRGIAIIAVVTIHTCGFGTVGIVLRPFLNFAVALFLGLSGFLTSADLSYHKIRKRSIRVLIPYVIWSLIYTAVRGTWARFPLNFLTGYCCGVFYYIVVYLELTLLAPPAGKLLRSKYRMWGFLMTPLAILIEYLIEWSGHPIPKPWHQLFFPVWFLFFYLGMFLREELSHNENFLFLQKEKRQGAIRFLKVCLLVSLPVQILEGYLWKMAGYSRMPYTQIKLSAMVTSTLVLLLAILWVTDTGKSMLPSLLERSFRYIGDISFGIYLTHILCKDLLKLSLYRIVEVDFPYTTIILLIVDILVLSVLRLLLPKKISRMLGIT